MTRVSVVIPNWNGARWLAPCLTALRAQTFRDFSVVVVDNGSTDESLAVLARFPEVVVVALPENVGFAAGMNAGFAAMDSEFAAALNNDTEAAAGWLAGLMAEMDRLPAEFGACGSKILDYSDPPAIDTVGDGLSLVGLSYKTGAGAADPGRHDEPTEIFAASAAAALYRRRMLDEIGGFDDGFFAYMEDVELCVRARVAGWRVAYAPNAVVRHAGAASSGGAPSAFTVRMTTKNAYALILKTIPWPLALVMLPLTFGFQLALAAACLATGRPAWLRAQLPAWRAGVAQAAREAPAMIAKRRAARPRGSAFAAAQAILRWTPLLPKRSSRTGR